MSIFKGSAVALVTPFNNDNSVNYGKLKALVQYHLEKNTDALVICGTTGEGSTLTVNEKLKCFCVAVEEANGKIPVIAGTGSNCTDNAVKLMKQAEKTGIDAHLSVTPYYNKASQNGLVEHYYALAENSEKPVIVYNVPSRTGVNIQPETYEKLAHHKNIKAVKEADSNPVKLLESIKLCGNKLDFYTGNDDSIALSTLMGAKGVISVMANILPSETHDTAMYGINGNAEKAFDLQKKYLKLINLLFSDVNPVPVKTAMNYLGFEVGSFRLPLTKMTDTPKSKLTEEIDFLKCFGSVLSS